MDDSYGNTEPNCSGLFRNLEEQRKIIEQQQFVLDDITDWAYKEIERIKEEYEKKNHWSVSLRLVKKELVLSNELLCLSLVQFRIRDAF